MAWTGTDEQFQAFIDEHGLSFPQVSDDAGDVFAYFDIPYQPAMAVISPDGEVATHVGALAPEEIDELVRDAVG